MCCDRREKGISKKKKKKKQIEGRKKKRLGSAKAVRRLAIRVFGKAGC